jgi:hypothetical protein
MSRKRFTVIAGITALLAAMPCSGSLAQTAPGGPYAPRLRHGRPRIEITPGPLRQRRCVDWLELQYRPSGTVLYPRYRCWWVRG